MSLTYYNLHDGPPGDWLRDLLERLPNLQSLCVAKYPYFDHASLLALNGKVRTIRPTACFAKGSLRLLDASYCTNATVFGLAEAVRSFPNLMYLDLSGIVAARGSSVLASLRHLQELKVLRLRNLDLRDDDFIVLITAIGQRVRGLDVSSNRLTDRSVAILGSCLSENRNRIVRGSHEHVTNDEHLERHLYDLLTTGFINRLTVEDVSGPGIKRLWISSNNLTSTGLCALLFLPSICLLDADSHSTAVPGVLNGLVYANDARLNFIQSPTSIIRSDSLTLVRQTPTLTYVRIHHSLVTERVPVGCHLDCFDVKGCFTTLSVVLRTLLETTEPLRWLCEERHKRLEHRQSQHIYFHPLMLPQLRRLVLTEVPARSATPKIAQGLIAFIQECAHEALLARLEAELDYTIAPNRTDQARNLFPLRILELEMLQSKLTEPAKRWIDRPGTCSVTGDTDSQVLWSAAELDFSFFRSHKEKAGDGGVPVDYYPQTHGPTANALAPRILISTFDVVEELRDFRKKAREKYEAAKKRGGPLTSANAFWDGNINILRCGSS